MAVTVDHVMVEARAASFTTRSISFTLAASAAGEATVAFYVSSPGNTWLAVDNVSLN